MNSLSAPVRLHVIAEEAAKGEPSPTDGSEKIAIVVCNRESVNGEGEGVGEKCLLGQPSFLFLPWLAERASFVNDGIRAYFLGGYECLV